MTRVVVTVMPRTGVLDPQGQAVRGAFGGLGFDGVHDVRGATSSSPSRGRTPRPRPARCAGPAGQPLIEDFDMSVAVI
ncbi:MAG: phosphoribosylformylglycinamidine synthase subunit PurS [Thermoleophilia bacterium]